MFKSIEINGHNIGYKRLNHDVNGNPRVIVHFADILKIADEPIDYSDQSIEKARKLVHGRKYRAKYQGGFIVMQTFSLQDELEKLIKTRK